MRPRSGSLVDVSVFDDVVGMLQRRDVERLRLPGAVGHGAVGELGHETAIAGMPAIASEDFHAEAQLAFPVLRKDGNRVGPFDAKSDHVRVERREGDSVHSDQLAIDVELEIIVGNHEPGDDIAIPIDLDDRDLTQIHFGQRLRRDPGAFIVEIGKLRPCLEVVCSRHGELRPVLGQDLADRILADVHPGLVHGTWGKIFR